MGVEYVVIERDSNLNVGLFCGLWWVFIIMIGVAVEIGTGNARAGLVGESWPRIASQSFYLQADERVGEQQDMFGRHREQRIFAGSVDVWRSDVRATKVFQEDWQDEKRIRLHGVKISKEGYLRLLGELLRQLRELKEKHHGLNEQTGEYGLLLIQPPYLSKQETIRLREAVSSFVFDQMRLSGVHFLKGSVAVTYSQGRNSAIVVDSGHSFTTISRVVDGYCEKTVTFNFGGSLINHELEAVLRRRGMLDRTAFCGSRRDRCQIFDSLSRQKEMTGLKSTFQIDPSAEIEGGSVQLQLADKSTISIGREEVPQPFTRAQEYRQKGEAWLPVTWRGVAWAVADLLQQQSCSNHIDTIILTGGNLQFSDVSTRMAQQLQRELTTRSISPKRVIVSSAGSSWTGGSVAASTEGFHNYWVSATEWRQGGIAVVQKKCPL